MAGREPVEPDEGQRLLLAMAEQLREHDKLQGQGDAPPSAPPSIIPSDAYRFARRIDGVDEWLQERGAATGSAVGRARMRASAQARGMSAAPAVHPNGLKGIDVWAGTGKVDWNQVKESGVDFVYVRAAYGTHPDKFALDHVRGARAAGLACGVYHFLRTSQGYQQQIDVMLRQLDLLGVGKGDLPPALDVEDNPAFDGPWNPANNDNYLTALSFWIEAVRKKTNDAAPVLYTRAGFWQELGNPNGFDKCPLWVASYKRAEPSLPHGWNRFDFWQYSDSGNVAGIAGPVDLNSFPGTMAELEALLLK
jgi:lysozyme